MIFDVEKSARCKRVLVVTELVVRGTHRVSTASGNQGKLEGIFPVREKSGNLAFFFKESGKNQGILMTQFFFFNDTIYFHGHKGRITAGCVGLRYLYS